MSFVLAAFEVMDKEPPLPYLSRLVQHGRYWNVVSTSPPQYSPHYSVTVVLLGAFALYLELSDPSVGEAIVKEGGFAYLGGCGIAILAGIGMPLLGAFVGANKLQQSAAAWRWTAGVSGAAPFGLTLFMGSAFVESAYYDYIFYPKRKRERVTSCRCDGRTLWQGFQSRAFWLDYSFFRPICCAQPSGVRRTVLVDSNEQDRSCVSLSDWRYCCSIILQHFAATGLRNTHTGRNPSWNIALNDCASYSQKVWIQNDGGPCKEDSVRRQTHRGQRGFREDAGTHQSGFG